MGIFTRDIILITIQLHDYHVSRHFLFTCTYQLIERMYGMYGKKILVSKLFSILLQIKTKTENVSFFFCTESCIPLS